MSTVFIYLRRRVENKVSIVIRLDDLGSVVLLLSVDGRQDDKLTWTEKVCEHRRGKF